MHWKIYFSIALYWYDLCHKPRNAECLIHLNLRCAYNHINCLMLVCKGWFVFFPKVLMLHQLWWFNTLWIYMIVCPFNVNNGWVHCERLFSIVLYWYGPWHKPCNIECMIHFDLRYAYNHFDWLVLVYTIILSLRQAFQGLIPNGSFVYLICCNLVSINVLKTPECFWGQKSTEYLGVIVDNDTLRLATHTFAAIRNWHLTTTQRDMDGVFCKIYSYGNCICHYFDYASNATNWLVPYIRTSLVMLFILR